jgi:hypothetical protein
VCVTSCWRCGADVREGKACRFCAERDRLANGVRPEFRLTSRELWLLILACLFVGSLLGRFLR